MDIKLEEQDYAQEWFSRFRRVVDCKREIIKSNEILVSGCTPNMGGTTLHCVLNL